MSSLWLSKKKKSELVNLCQQAGLDTGGYLKSDLEGMLTAHLQANQIELAADTTFAPYFETISRSPSKNASASGETRARRRTSRYVPGTASFEEPTTTESTPEPSSTERKTRASSRGLRTPRASRALRDSALLPPTPAIVADEIETRANQIIASAKKAIEKTDIKEKATNVRDRLSNVISVNATSLSLEALLLLAAIIPVTYELTVPAVAALGTPATTYVLPDLFIVLTTTFWAPFLTWFVTSLVLPVGNAVLFNFVAVSVSSKEDNEYQVDPLTFAVTKALLAYLVHYKAFTFGGVLGEQAVATVGGSVGRELQLIGSAIGIIAAIWEATLRR